MAEAGEVAVSCDGEIVSVTETRHAIGIMGPDEMEILNQGETVLKEVKLGHYIVERNSEKETQM